MAAVRASAEQITRAHRPSRSHYTIYWPVLIFKHHCARCSNRRLYDVPIQASSERGTHVMCFIHPGSNTVEIAAAHECSSGFPRVSYYKLQTHYTSYPERSPGRLTGVRGTCNIGLSPVAGRREALHKLKHSCPRTTWSATKLPHQLSSQPQYFVGHRCDGFTI